LVISNPGFIDTGNNENAIYSMQFINPTGSQEFLLLGGSPSLGLKIYKINDSGQSPRFKLVHSLEFENSNVVNCFVVKGKYLFAMA
jgi:hypothetical protein